MKNILKITTLCLLALFTLWRCGGDSSSESGICEAPSVDLNGIWIITETSGPNTCGEDEGDVETYTMNISQNGNSLLTPDSFTGLVCGNSVKLSGSYPDGDGTITITITGSGTSTFFSGTASWNYTETGYSCSGSNSFTATKQ